MNEKINSEIKKNQFVNDAVNVPVHHLPNFKQKDPAEILQEQIEKQNKQKMKKLFNKKKDNELDLIPDREKNNTSQNNQVSQSSIESQEMKTYSYLRSKNQVLNIVRDNFDINQQEKETEKMQIIRQLNDYLIQLDKLNEEKRLMQTKLIQQIKFVRDLQSQLGTSDNGHITEIIDHDLENQFRKEKQINLQLKEKLKQCEIEKQQILENLKFLQSKKNVTIVCKSGNHSDLDKQSMNLGDMIKYRHNVIHNLDEVVRDLDILRSDDQQAIQALQYLQEQIIRTSEERAQLIHSIQTFNGRIQDGHGQINSDFRSFKFHVFKNQQILGAKVIQKSLFNILKKRKQHNFEYLMKKIKYDDQQIGSILAIRKICLKYKYQRQEKYFNIWFQKGMRPMNQLKYNRQITNFHKRNNLIYKFYRQWRLQKLKSQKKYSNNIQKMHQLLYVMNNFKYKQLKYQFKIWHLNSKKIKNGRDNLSKFVRERLLYKCRQAFLKWNNVVVHQDFVLRLRSVATRTAKLQLMTNVFQAWRRQTLRFKVIRISILNSTWKALKKLRNSDHNFQLQTYLVLKNQKEKNSFLLKKCFDSIRSICKSEKHEINSFQLNDNTLKINSNQQDVFDLSERFKLKNQKFCTTVVMNMFAGKIFMYFLKWKSYTENYSKIIIKKHRELMISRFRMLLKDAFFIWKNIQITRRRRKVMSNIQEYSSETKEIQVQIRQTQLKNDDIQVRSLNKSKAKIKKIVLKIQNKVLKFGFGVWHGIISQKNYNSNYLYFVALKSQRRSLRFSFMKYVEQIKIKRIYDNGDLHAEDYADAIKFKAKKRMFKAIKKFYLNFHCAKINLKQTLKQADLRFKKCFFQIWLNEVQHLIKESKRENENQLVDKTYSTQKQEGDLNSLHHRQSQEINSLQKQRISLARKTLAKTINRYSNYQLYSAFLVWRTNLKDYNHLFHSTKFQILQRMHFRLQHNAFQKWRLSDSFLIKKNSINTINQSISKQKNEQQIIDQAQSKKQVNFEQKSQQLQNIQAIQQYQMKINSNITDKIASIKLNNFSINKLEHMFKQWKKYVIKKQLTTNRLSVLISKNLMQKGFEYVRQLGWVEKQQIRKQRGIRKIMFIFYHRRRKLALNVWKSIIFKNVTQQTSKVDQVLFHDSKNGEFKRTQIQTNIVEFMKILILQKYRKGTIQRLLQYKYQKQNNVQKLEEMQDLILGLRQRKAVQIWKARSKKSIVGKQKVYNFKQNRRSFYLRKCFEEMKFQFLTKSIIAKNLFNMSKICQKEHLRFAFRSLQWVHSLNSFTLNKSHQNACNILSDLLKKKNDQKLKQQINQWRNQVKIKNQINMIIKSIFQRRFVIQFKSYFIKWKNICEQLIAIDDANDYGSARMQLNTHEQNVKNLRQFLIKQGYLDREIDKIIQQDNNKYLQTAEKTMCRLLLFGEGKNNQSDQYLMPWCIDKWKQFVKEKKVYRYWLLFIEKRRGIMRKEIYQYFLKWRMLIDIRKQQLYGMRYQQLKFINIKEKEIIKDLSVEISQKQQNIDELKDQRDFLLQKVVSAQKLALDACSQNYKKAQMKAFGRFRENYGKRMVEEYEDLNLQAFQNSLDLKQRIKELEEQNERIVMDNENLKSGALESVNLIRNTENVQNEVEQLSSSLADKAKEIRNLLQKNQSLKQQLKQVKK